MINTKILFERRRKFRNQEKDYFGEKSSEIHKEPATLGYLGCGIMAAGAGETVRLYLHIPSVQEVVTHLYSKLLYKMGSYYIDI